MIKPIIAPNGILSKLTSTNTGVNPKLTSGATSETHHSGDTITSPTPFFSFIIEVII